MNATLHRRLFVLVLAGIFALQVLAAHAGVIFRTAALTGTQAPGTPSGAVFGTFEVPVLNAAGQTAFYATLQTTAGGVTSTSDSGIWSEGAGILSLVAREDSQAPGTNAGSKFGGFASVPVLNAAGQTAFRAELQSGAGGYAGIWAGGTGTLALVAIEGSQAPSTPAGSHFFGVGYPVFNSNGGVAFYSQLFPYVGSMKWGVWSSESGTLSPVALGGSQAPDTPIGASFASLRDPALNDLGRTTFLAYLTGSSAGVTSTNSFGIWSEGSGTLALVAREGNQAPGTPAGANFGGGLPFYSSYQPFSDPVMNNAGSTVFVAALRTGSGDVTASNNEGVWTQRDGTTSLVARKGSQAPGTPTGDNFAGFFTPVINDSSHIAFRAWLRTGTGEVTTSNDTGIWSEGPSGLSIIAREGSQAPGTPTGTNFADLMLAPSSAPSMNASGRVAFLAALEGSAFVTTSNYQGIWAESPNGELSLVVRQGNMLEVAPGDFRTIQSLQFNPGGRVSSKPSGGQDGRGITFNDDFTLAFWASFTDGTSGIFTATLTAVPEPATLALLCIAAMFVPRRWGANSAK